MRAYLTLHLCSFPAIFDAAVETIPDVKPHLYPYKGLEESLKQQGKQTIPIFTFGSLLDKKSAAKTFSKNTLDTSKEVVAYGTKRVFNRDIPVDPKHHWSIPCNPKSRAMLNLIPTGREQDITNGVLIYVDIEDISAMRGREYGYDLVPVFVAFWEDYWNKENPELIIAYTFHSPEDTIFTNEEILPRPGYYELTRDAAYSRGPKFYRMWLESTFLSDKITPIFIWEQCVRQGDDRTKSRL